MELFSIKIRCTFQLVSTEEVDGYQIPQDVIEDYQDYIHCKSGRKAKEELRERYSSTYWYYSDYIH